jgi:hypothetical protein
MLLFPFDKHFQLARAGGIHEDFVIAFALVGIGAGKVGDGLVELVALAQVAADLGACVLSDGLVSMGCCCSVFLDDVLTFAMAIRC